jgi:hypothetical protein
VALQTTHSHTQPCSKTKAGQEEEQEREEDEEVEELEEEEEDLCSHVSVHFCKWSAIISQVSPSC